MAHEMTILMRTGDKFISHGSEKELLEIIDQIFKIKADGKTDWYELPELIIDVSEVIAIMKPQPEEEAEKLRQLFDKDTKDL